MSIKDCQGSPISCFERGLFEVDVRERIIRYPVPGYPDMKLYKDDWAHQNTRSSLSGIGGITQSRTAICLLHLNSRGVMVILHRRTTSRSPIQLDRERETNQLIGVFISHIRDISRVRP